jgi:hypothetical protein
MRLEVGQLVRLKKSIPNLKLCEGDLAILTEIDWDHRDYPVGVGNTSGRGYFFFPNRAPSEMRENQLGYMLIYESFEVLDD